EYLMTSRERILAALDHREPDRVPVDLSGHRSSGINAMAYARLREFMGLDRKPIRVYDPIQQLAIVDEDVLEAFGVDTVELGRGFALDESDWVDWVLPDETPCRMPAWAAPERLGDEWVLRSKASGRVIGRMPRGGLYFEQTYFPFAEEPFSQSANLDSFPSVFDEGMWGVFDSPPGPLVSGPDGKKLLAAGAARLREKTGRAVLGLFGGNLYEGGQSLYGYENFFLLLGAEPVQAHKFLDRFVEINMEALEEFMAAAGPYIDIIVFGDDLGMQTGPQISPEMYREFFKDRHRLMWNRAKELGDVRVMLHCCGGVRQLLPDLIEAGLDAINPVQISCSGMDAGELKKEFGSEITFWGGGCDTREILPEGNPDSVRRHVTEQLETLSPGGGFVFQQVHNILADVPPENIVAMFEAVKDPDYS
ncbi:MAG: uroporphyrinogen decarboxylase family protein, partial [Gemmatimonadota bacterium]|nr:uroporphyrinogen decarboxylase family protein [Gemmatimonadota bacterium]